MAIKVILNIDGVADAMGTAAYGTAAKAIIERGTASGGAYSAAGTVALAATQSQYEWWDASATDPAWYRFRLWDNATTYSAYSDPFQMAARDAYATLDDFLERVILPDESRYNLASDILRAVSSQFDQEAGRQFYRIPQVSGTTARLYNGAGSSYLRVPEGIVSLTTVEIANQTGGSYTALTASEYQLQPRYPQTGEPYTGIQLTDLATTWFTEGFDTVRLTGVFGWSSIPALITEAVLQMSILMFNQALTRSGGPTGADFGQVSLPEPAPRAWWRALAAYGRYGSRKATAV